MSGKKRSSTEPEVRCAVCNFGQIRPYIFPRYMLPNGSPLHFCSHRCQTALEIKWEGIGYLDRHPESCSKLDDPTGG